ncbi:hypothetical protein D3C84_1188970 [compost metagenome]
MAMPQRVNRNTASKIDEFTTLLIPHAGAGRLDRDETGRRVVRDHDLIEGIAGNVGAH